MSYHACIVCILSDIKLIVYIYNTYIACSEECMKTFEDLPSVIRVLAMNLSEEEFRIYVRRNHVLEDAIKAVSRKCFSCHFSLKVG